MIVHEIGVVLVVAGILGIIMRLLKQPTILAYVLAGVVVGPLAFGWVVHQQAIAELSELAVVVMLFVIGIEMDLSRLKKVGLVAILGGAIQVGATFLMGFFLSKMFGMTNIAASYLGFALAFSSTMLVVKILGEKYDMDTLYGRIVVGILIMQDIFAIFALSILSTADSEFSLTSLLSTSTLTAGLILIVVFLFGKRVLPRLFDYAARDREILFLVTMATLFIVAFYAENQKLSMGIGSFLAGLAIAELSYKYEVVGDLKALKSFFTILFFAALGLQLAPNVAATSGPEITPNIMDFLATVWANLGLIVSFSFLAIVVKPVLVTIIVRMFGYQKTVAINSGLALGQLSEFSLVLLAQGVVSKNIDAELLSPIIIVTIVSMILSSYIMDADLLINRVLGKCTGWLEFISLAKPQFDFPTNEAENNFSVLLVGRDKLGRIIEKALRRLKIRYIVVDSNPDVIARLKAAKIPCIFGDINNHEVLSQLDFTKIQTVFSTIPDIRDNELLIAHIKGISPSVNFISIVDSRSRAEELYRLGAHYVLVTYMLAGTQLIHNHGAERNGINLRSLIEDIEGVREKGKQHRACLYDDLSELHDGSLEEEAEEKAVS